MRLMFDQLERAANGPAQAFGIVTLHRQAAAFLRTVGREGRDDGMAARLHAGMQAVDIGCAVLFLDQEVKRRAVVPDVEGLRRLPNRRIGRDPLHGGALLAEARLRRLQRGFRQIQHRDRGKTVCQQGIDQRELKPGPLYTKARKLYWDFAHAVKLAA